MGNREALLEAAIVCLNEKGYARTTARDLASTAGTSLAAIGYHFGGTQELLNEAVHAAVERWGDELQERMRAEAKPGQGYLARFADVWERLRASFRDDRPMWSASLDLLGQVEHVPAIKDMLRAALPQARAGHVAMFDAVEEETVDARQARTLGAFYYSLMLGVLMQWLIDPDSAPTPDDLVEALQAVAARVVEPTAGGHRG